MKPRLRKKDRLKARQAAKPLSRKATKQARASAKKEAQPIPPATDDELGQLIDELGQDQTIEAPGGFEPAPFAGSDPDNQ